MSNHNIFLDDLCWEWGVIVWVQKYMELLKWTVKLSRFSKPLTFSQTFNDNYPQKATTKQKSTCENRFENENPHDSLQCWDRQVCISYFYASLKKNRISAYKNTMSINLIDFVYKGRTELYEWNDQIMRIAGFYDHTNYYGYVKCNEIRSTIRIIILTFSFPFTPSNQKSEFISFKWFKKRVNKTNSHTIL